MLLGIVMLVGVCAEARGAVARRGLRCCWRSAAPGLGVMYPVTTTIVQNAVEPHQLGIATGALNFFRLLGGAIIVAAFGAIVLGGVDAGGQGLTLEMLSRRRAAFGRRSRRVVPLRCSSPARCSSRAGLVAVLAIEERPLRGPREAMGSRRRGASDRAAIGRHSCPACLARCNLLQHAASKLRGEPCDRGFFPRMKFTTTARAGAQEAARPPPCRARRARPQRRRSRADASRCADGSATPRSAPSSSA